MKRRILIIDDHDDLASSLKEVFSAAGHEVTTYENRAEALTVRDLDTFDLVITDLDNERSPSMGSSNGTTPAPGSATSKTVKAFKLSGTNFRRDEFDENELKDLVETVLNFKIRFVDTEHYVRNLHEHIEFELPSAISPMYSILEYLTRRVEKLGVVRAEQSNLFVALDEAFVNAVKHGNKFDARKVIRVTAEVSSHEARFTIEDEGDGFDINSIPDPLDPGNLFKSSGRGVFFIYNIMDDVQYNQRGNCLTMVKRAQPLPSTTNEKCGS